MEKYFLPIKKSFTPIPQPVWTGNIFFFIDGITSFHLHLVAIIYANYVINDNGMHNIFGKLFTVLLRTGAHLGYFSIRNNLKTNRI
jgi:hypothetical protein